MNVKTIQNHPKVFASYDTVSEKITLDPGTIFSIDPTNLKNHPQSDYNKARLFLKNRSVVKLPAGTLEVKKQITVPTSSAWVLISGQTGGFAKWIISDPAYPLWNGKSLADFRSGVIPAPTPSLIGGPISPPATASPAVVPKSIAPPPTFIPPPVPPPVPPPLLPKSSTCDDLIKALVDWIQRDPNIYQIGGIYTQVRNPTVGMGWDGRIRNYVYAIRPPPNCFAYVYMEVCPVIGRLAGLTVGKYDWHAISNTNRISAVDDA